MFNFNTDTKNEKSLREQRAEYRETLEALMVDHAAKALKEGMTRDVVCHTLSVVVKGYNQAAKSEDVRQAVEKAIDDRLDQMESETKTKGK